MSKMIPRHAEFARRVAGGEQASSVFRDLYPKSRAWKDEYVHIKSSQLLAKVRIKVDELQKKADDETIMDIRERKQLLTKIARGTVADFVTAGADGVVVNVGPENINSPALKSVKSRCITTGEGDGKQDAVITEVETRDPIAAISELNKMEKVYTDGSGDRQLVVILRDAPRIGVEKPAIEAKVIQKKLKA